jgi:hypothetical protein
VSATDSHSGMLSLTTPALDKGTSALHPSKYSAVSHNHIPINKVDETPGTKLFLIGKNRTKPGSTGHCWYLQVGINFHDNHDAKTTMLLGLSALMGILPGAIDGFELHPLDEHSSLPPLTNNKVEECFPGLAVLAFKYFLVRDKRNRAPQQVVVSTPSPHRFNNEEDYKPPTAMWGIIRVKGNGNIKEACEVLAWDMTCSGLQVPWREHQLAESSAQVLLMNVPPVLECSGVEGKIIWHLTEIKKGL